MGSDGGLEQIVFDYCSRLDKEKFEVDFIIDEDSTFIPRDKIEKAGINIVIVPPYQKVLNYQKALVKIFKENKYDIVHSHENALSVFPLRAAKKAGIKVRIAHSHSTSNKKEWKKNILKNILRPFSKLYATDYMCCSELAGRYLFGNKTYKEGKVYLLNNAIDVEKFKYNENVRVEIRKELSIKPNTLVIGHIGRFVAQKNHEFLIDIFNEVHKQNENSVLVLVGQGPLQERIQEKVRILGLEQYVKFLGQRTDVNKLYQGFDFFCLPSLYEGLGMVLIEAQVSGLKCIASSEVPNSAKVTDRLKFIKLYDEAEKWANEILKCSMESERKNFDEEIKNIGYEINFEVKKLENEYIKKLNRGEC